MRRVVRVPVAVGQRRLLLLRQQLCRAQGRSQSMVSVAVLGIRGRRNVRVGVLVLIAMLIIRSVFSWQWMKVGGFCVKFDSGRGWLG
jgi:hypothetical protein